MARRTDAQEPIHGRADDPDLAGRGGWLGEGDRAPTRDLGEDLLHVESEVRGPGADRSQAAQAARGGERAAQETGGEPGARRAVAQGAAGKRLVTVTARREAVTRVLEHAGVSERRALGLVRLH